MHTLIHACMGSYVQAGMQTNKRGYVQHGVGNNDMISPARSRADGFKSSGFVVSRRASVFVVRRKGGSLQITDAAKLPVWCITVQVFVDGEAVYLLTWYCFM